MFCNLNQDIIIIESSSHILLVIDFICLPSIFVAIRQDQSSTGHILGLAQAQPQTVTSTRNLNSLPCGVLRCLTHIAMLLGTDHDIQVCQLNLFSL